MEADKELILRARAGDAAAFGILIERHQKAVIGFLMSMLHDLDMAEEAAQIAFVNAFKALGSFEGRSSFRTWITRIALNAARSQQRWARLRRWLPLSPSRVDEEESWEESLQEAARAPNEFEALEKKLDLERAMAALPPREKEMAALRLEGYSLVEIADILGVSEGTVKSTLFEATQKMRKRLL